MGASIDKLHNNARRAIESGEDKFREAAELLAQARKLGATQRQSAKAIGKSPAWVNALLKWKSGGYKNWCPFPRAARHVQPAGPGPNSSLRNQQRVGWLGHRASALAVCA